MNIYLSGELRSAKVRRLENVSASVNKYDFVYLSGYSKDLYTVTGSSPESSARIGQPKASPFFTSRGETYKAKVRDSVVLLCQVENLGKTNVQG